MKKEFVETKMQSKHFGTCNFLNIYEGSLLPKLFRVLPLIIMQLLWHRMLVVVVNQCSVPKVMMTLWVIQVSSGHGTSGHIASSDVMCGATFSSTVY